MKALIFALLTTVFGISFFTAPNVSALGLKVAPLEYKTTLKAGETKQGFVDVSNPSTQAVAVKISVQAFKQIDDNGGLQFYDDDRVQAGIKPDIKTLDLGPREAARVLFSIDGNTLPEGDVYAAIFFTTDPKQPTNGVGQLVRVGTLLSVVNKTPGSRAAAVSELMVPFFQLGDSIKGSYAIKNTGSASGGFYPTVSITARPSGDSKQSQSSLVFGGRERSNDFTLDAGYGIHNVEVGYGDSKRSQWVLTIPPWMIVLALLIFVIVGIELLLLRKRRKSARK